MYPRIGRPFHGLPFRAQAVYLRDLFQHGLEIMDEALLIAE